MLRADVGARTNRFAPTFLSEPVVAQYVARVSVWGRWFIGTVVGFELAYRPADWYPEDIAYVYLLAPLAMVNGLVHVRLRTSRPVTWRWLLLLSAMDMMVITSHAVIGGGFKSFAFLAYYPAVAMFAVAFTSFWLVFVWSTITAIAYVSLSLTVDSGLDIAGGDLRVLVARLAALYAVAVGLSFVIRFERTTRRAALKRERTLERQRKELSQAIHDTAAQSAYMIGLGIDAARQIAGNENEELNVRLEATALMSKAAIWQLRHPIDMGRIFEGKRLGPTLDSHVSMFTTVTSVPAALTQEGLEPSLSTEAKSKLFTVAHNALTNAFRHAEASTVFIELSFGRHEVRLSVSDDGKGLPDDYEQRGHGFSNMCTLAEGLGGRLAVETRGPDGGAKVTCVMPLGRRGTEE